jgi:hypothetical protein
MTISDASWSSSLRRIGDLERGDHFYLRDSDQCYFFGEYTAYKGWSHSETNQLIANLKKKPSTRDTVQWTYKLDAIGRLARSIAANLRPEALSGITFIPIPPSKPAAHPDYDDRMAQVAARIRPGGDARDVLFTEFERDARHTSGGRRDPDALRQTLGIRKDLLLTPAPTTIALLDDVLTTGCSFTVCRDLLAALVPDVTIVGIFAARRVIDRSAAFEDFADLDFD